MPRKTKAERAEYMRNYRAGLKGVEGTHTGLIDMATGETIVYGQPRPSFLAAPVDACPLCGHDRQEADHLGGRPCRFKTSPRRNCGCNFEGF